MLITHHNDYMFSQSVSRTARAPQLFPPSPSSSFLSFTWWRRKTLQRSREGRFLKQDLLEKKTELISILKVLLYLQTEEEKSNHIQFKIPIPRKPVHVLEFSVNRISRKSTAAVIRSQSSWFEEMPVISFKDSNRLTCQLSTSRAISKYI